MFVDFKNMKKYIQLLVTLK